MKDQFFADYLERLEGLQHRLHQAVGNLPAAALDWSPGPEMNPVMNSVAVLLAHITGVLHEGIDLALGDPPGRVRAQEFQTRAVLSAEMLRRLDAVIDYARGALPCLALEDLAQARQDEDGPVTCGWALLHALEHAYLHLGHLQVTCQSFNSLMLARAVHNYAEKQPLSHSIIFDRAIPDMIAYANLFQLDTTSYGNASQALRYNPTVFYFAGWEEIYTNDEERKPSGLTSKPSMKVLATAFLKFPDFPLNRESNLYWQEFEGEHQGDNAI